MALADLRKQRLVPKLPDRSRWQRFEGPWPSWWACWELARSDATKPFISALREAYPARFGEESKFQYRDPEEYVRAYLRAVVAANLVERGRVGIDSRPTKAMLEELHRVATREGQEFACVWLIDEVDFRSVAGQYAGLVRLHQPTSPPETLVSSLLPEALWASDRGYPIPGAKRAGLFSGTGTGSSHHWDVTKRLNDSMYRLLQVLRLATSTTARVEMVWLGETSMVHVDSPIAHPQREDFPRSKWERVGTVTPEMLPGLARLAEAIEVLERPRKRRRGQDILSPVVVALRRFGRSYRATTWQDSVLDLATALEAALGPRSAEQEIGLTLRTRAAHLLTADNPDDAERIFRDVADLYGLRSDIIHGNVMLRKALQTLWSERGYDQVLEEDRMLHLMDRWRDIVRRAITARLLLSEATVGERPHWDSLGDDQGVDIALVRSDRRNEWRRHMAGVAASFGLPLLVEAAPPLIDYLHE